MYPVPNANVSKWTRQHSVSWKYTVVDPTELTERRFASVSSALASIACSNAFADDSRHQRARKDAQRRSAKFNEASILAPQHIAAHERARRGRPTQLAKVLGLLLGQSCYSYGGHAEAQLRRPLWRLLPCSR
jgi:hypothetical protein